MEQGIKKKQNRVVISSDVVGDHVNVVVMGEVDSNTSMKLEEVLRGLITKGHKKIALALDNVPIITSAGLRVLLVIAKALYQSGGSFAMYGCQPNVKEVFKVSGFDTILNIENSYEDLVATFGQPAVAAQTGVETQHIYH